MKVSILHLDLGIGGAEQLIVTLAIQLQSLGHDVKIATTHHDINHCFAETKEQGVLGKSVIVIGDWLPRNIFNKATALCAIIRMFYLSLIIATTSKPDLIIIDGVSASIPVLKFAGLKVIFYCHFPDQLLCVDRGSILKRLYRKVIDKLEEITTGCADEILVNSCFTRKVFIDTFRSLGRVYEPKVLYPIINEEAADAIITDEQDLISYCNGRDIVFVSLNRYERKKNIQLAIDSYRHFKVLSKKDIQYSRSVLVIA
eukprot:gene5331-7398_t